MIRNHTKLQVINETHEIGLCRLFMTIAKLRIHIYNRYEHSHLAAANTGSRFLVSGSPITSLAEEL